MVQGLNSVSDVHSRPWNSRAREGSARPESLCRLPLHSKQLVSGQQEERTRGTRGRDRERDSYQPQLTGTGW